MLSWNNYLIKKEQYEDLRREADKDRFIHQVLATRGIGEHIHVRVLRRLGYWLAAWGCYLREHFAGEPCSDSGSRIDLYASKAT